MDRIVFFLFLVNLLNAQTIPADRTVEWSSAIKDINHDMTSFIQIGNGVLDGNGTTANDEIFRTILQDVQPAGTTIILPKGDFLFNEPIVLPPGTILKGFNSHETRFLMDLKGSGDAFSIKGVSINSDKSVIKESFGKGQNFIVVDDASSWSAGQWFKITIDDKSLVTSDWAYNSVGQIMQIKSISGNTLHLNQKLRLQAETNGLPVITRIEPIQNVGIECLTIERLDNTAPQQTSNIYFENAVNCWVKGVQSLNSNFGHITISSSSNIQVKRSYMHSAFEYSGGGRGYGVVLQFTTGECLIENNIFRHLRHSVLLQAGANGNVISYNYSHDPFWTSSPSDAAGDMVLHGNYVFANLFEQNICQNIVIDNSHGPNGPHNTFFRNRAEKYGIFFSAANSPSQNIVGNEIPNTVFPYSFVNYTINGADQFTYSNNNKGVIVPVNTTNFPEKSLVYYVKPNFLSDDQWGGIGSPNAVSSRNIPAYDRWKDANPMYNACSEMLSNNDTEETEGIVYYPNPFHNELTIKSNTKIQKCVLYNVVGKIIFAETPNKEVLKVNSSHWFPGIYLVVLIDENNLSKTFKVFKY